MPTASGAYLFVNSDDGDRSDSSSVFYCCSDSTHAQSLCNLFTREYSTKARTLRFHFRPLATISLEDRVLLDEELQWLAVYSDPDRTAYDPEPSKQQHERAMFAVQATDWENSLRQHTAAKPTSADGANRPGSPSDQAQLALSALLHAVERHRLMFLYWATAHRRNPLVSHRRTGAIEELDKDGFRGWDAMVADIDADGAFLWKHRVVLDRYAQAAIEKFGPGDGAFPTTTDSNGVSIPVDGGSPPYWLIPDIAPPYLEASSDAILESARTLGHAIESAEARGLVEEAVAASRPEEHPRWYACVWVRWNHLSRLDVLIRRIKHALALQTSGAHQRVQTASASPDPAAVSMTPAERKNAAVCLLMRLAQVYYKLLESVTGRDCAVLDMELNQSYLWVVGNLTNLLKNHEDLQDFPRPFEPYLPDLYPQTVRDLDWEDMVAPEAEAFLSTVQQYAQLRGLRDPVPGSASWTFLELFRAGIDLSIARAGDYRKRVDEMFRDLLRRASSPSKPAVSKLAKDNSTVADPTNAEPEEISMTVAVPEDLATESQAIDERQSANNPNPQWLLLNDRERNILQAMLENSVTDQMKPNLPGQKLVATWAGYDLDTTFKTSLSGLVKAGLLVNGKHTGKRGGYSLTAEGVKAATFFQQS